MWEKTKAGGAKWGLRPAERAFGPWVNLIALYKTITGNPPDMTETENLVIPAFWNQIMKKYGWTSKFLDKNVKLKKRLLDMAKRGLIPTAAMPAVSKITGYAAAPVELHQAI